MAYTPAVTSCPSTTNTQDIGSTAKAVRKTHTIDIEMPTMPPPSRWARRWGRVVASQWWWQDINSPTRNWRLTRPLQQWAPSYPRHEPRVPWHAHCLWPRLPEDRLLTATGPELAAIRWSAELGTWNASDGDGHLQTSVDNLYDIGSPAVARARSTRAPRWSHPSVEMPNSASITMGAGAAKYKLFHDNYGVNMGRMGITSVLLSTTNLDAG